MIHPVHYPVYLHDKIVVLLYSFHILFQSVYENRRKSMKEEARQKRNMEYVH